MAARLVAASALASAGAGACWRGEPDRSAAPATSSASTASPAPPTDDYVLVGPNGATAFETPPTPPVGAAGGVHLTKGFGFQPTGETRAVGGRRYLRVLDGHWLPESDVRHVKPSRFTGAHLGPGEPLRLAWTVAPSAPVLASPRAGAAGVGFLPRGFRVSLNGPCRDGFCPLDTGWVHTANLALPQPAPRPGAVGPRERWIDVDLSSQTLVAYEGDEPRFATLVATGIGGPGSPLATPVGVFRIRSKHAFVRMDNLEHTGVEPYAYDVPLAQYFSEGKALHAAPWHDHLGRPRSHGCINLSPSDARWLFDFTAPSLAAGNLEAASSPARPGTIVRVRGQLSAAGLL